MRYPAFFRPLTCLFLLIAFGNVPINAQVGKRDKAEYLRNSQEFKDEIWAWNLPQFNNSTITPEQKNTSYVVLARHVEIYAGSKRKGHGRELIITHIKRDRVMLNDAAAVKEYSSFKYTTFVKNGGYYGNSASTFIGVRIIKEGNKVRDIDMDEQVLTKSEANEEEARMAIPDLQPGDIIDFYVASESKTIQVGMKNSWSYYFPFVDDVPVLDYSVHCEIGPKYAVEYRRYNGAPDFAVSKDNDDNNVLDIGMKNLIVYPENTKWLSPLRQFPITQMNVVLGQEGMLASKVNGRKPGMVYKDQPSKVILWDEFLAIASSKGLLQQMPQLVKKSDIIQDAYDELKKKADDMSRDSLAAALYYMFRYDLLFNVNKNLNVSNFVNISERKLNSSVFAFLLTEYFTTNHLDAELLLSTSKFKPSITNVINRDDIGYLVYVPKAMSPIFGASNFYSCPFFCPSYMEGTKEAVSVDLSTVQVMNFTNVDWHNVFIPESPAASNVHLEQFTVDPELGSDGVKLHRLASLTGQFKDETQQKLLLLEDFYNYERSFFGETETLVEKFANMRHSKQLSEEVETALAEARKKQKDDFKADAKEFFDLEINDLNEPKIINPGVRQTSPVFSYSSDMKIPGVLKHAGNNYILEVGKLTGTALKAEEKERDRKLLDIYAPFARTIKVELTVNIPEGYQLEGLEKLSRQVVNPSGKFAVEAVLNGNKLTITTEKVYLHANEPAASWPNILAIIDAGDDWTSAKVLLRKI